MTIAINEDVKSFKYNLSFYYQSTIVYFVAILVYAFVKGEFLSDSFVLLIDDPVVYFLIAVAAFTILILAYNLFMNKHIEIRKDSITFAARFKKRRIDFERIKFIKIGKAKTKLKNIPFKLVKIKTIDRKMTYSINPYDYENQKELLDLLRQIKSALERDVEA